MNDTTKILSDLTMFTCTLRLRLEEHYFFLQLSFSSIFYVLPNENAANIRKTKARKHRPTARTIFGRHIEQKKYI